jgi:hypothetical protein
MKKQKNSAESVVAQAKSKSRAKNIENLNRVRTEFEECLESGKRSLFAIFPGKEKTGTHRVDLTFLLRYPDLEPLFSNAFLAWAAPLKKITRENGARNLRAGFFSYLYSEWPTDLRPQDLTDELLIGFRNHIVLLPTSRGSAITHGNARQLYGTPCRLMRSIKTGPWHEHARRIVEHSPHLAPKGLKISNPTDVIPLDILKEIINSAEQEILTIERRLEASITLLATGRDTLNSECKTEFKNKRDYRDLSTCLAAIDSAYRHVVPTNDEIRSENVYLGRAIDAYHGQQKVSSFFQPSARDLVPFVILLSVATVFNPSTILYLEWMSIDFNSEQAGRPALKIIGHKGRAGRNIPRLLEPEAAVSSKLTIKQLFLCLDRLTQRIRPALPVEFRERIFVFVPVCHPKKAKAFGTDHAVEFCPSTDAAWTKSLANFIADNKLPLFTLGQLRPTILDAAQSLGGSLEVARSLGDHRNPRTTWTHYTSASTKQKNRERIGQVLLLRERWFDSQGIIDPRKLTLDHDKGAATPGFSCLDPFDSQRPNQQSGRLCRDYGGCPSCPLAVAHPSDPICVAYYVALDQAILNSQASMSAQVWSKRWAPVWRDLKELLAWVPDEVLTVARKIPSQLPNVG